MSHRKIIIGLTGVKGSGKSTFASILNQVTDNGFEERMLAFKLKESCSKASGLHFDFFESQALKEKTLDNPIVLDLEKIQLILNEFDIPLSANNFSLIQPFIGQTFFTPRRMLQHVGTELLRTFDQEIHCNFLYRTLNKNSVVTDVRFANEYEFFKSKSDLYLPVYICNDIAEQAAIQDGHPSEMQVFQFKEKCIKVDNNVKTVENMRSQIINLLGEHLDIRK